MLKIFKKKKPAAPPIQEEAPEKEQRVISSAPKENEREPVLFVAVGYKGVGKTFQTCQELHEYIKVQKRPVVIFDTNQEIAYAQYAKIAPNDVKKLKKAEIRRVEPIMPPKNGKSAVPMDNKQKAACLAYLLKNFKNGLLVIEDMNNYLTSTRTDGIVSALTTNRHRSQDIIIHLQSLAKLDPTLWENTGVIRIHYQNDRLSRYIDRCSSPQILTLAVEYCRLKYEENPRVFVWLDLVNRKIIGVDDLDTFKTVCNMYLRQNNAERNQIAAEIETNNQKEINTHFYNFCKRYIN